MPDQSLLSTVRSDLADERDRLEAQISALEPGGGSAFDDNFADSGQVAAEQGENKVLASQLRSELDEVERALAKLDDGTYGKCETCGEAIASAAPRGHAGHEVLHPARVGAVATASHLVRRFFGSLRPGGPGADAEAWVATPACCRASWRCGGGCPGPIAVTPSASPSGWSEPSATRPPGRCSPPPCCTTSARSRAGSAPTGGWSPPLSAKVAGPDMAATWRKQRGVARRVGLYLQHDQIGGDLLELAGSDPLTVAWTREHHRPSVRVDRRAGHRDGPRSRRRRLS